MKRPSLARKTRGGETGLTLVELLVVLVILVGLMTAASVSTAGLRERHRVETTARAGQAVVDALNRSEGLSFVSDMGWLPGNPDELAFLFVRNHDADFPRAYTQHTLTIPNIPDVRVTNNMAMPVLGTGWRGPYCDTVKLDADFVLRDGFGGEWEFDGTNLISLGRNQELETFPEDAAWQDIDQVFSFNPEHLTDADLTVNVSLASSNIISELHVYYFKPKSRDDLTGGYTNWHAQVTGQSFSTNGLSVGKRVVFAYAKDSGGEFFSDPPRYLHIRPGNNAVDLTLFKKN